MAVWPGKPIALSARSARMRIVDRSQLIHGFQAGSQQPATRGVDPGVRIVAIHFYQFRDKALVFCADQLL